MSSEQGAGAKSSPSQATTATVDSSEEERDQPSSEPVTGQLKKEPHLTPEDSETETIKSESEKGKPKTEGESERKKAAKKYEISDTSSSNLPGEASQPRQVIAVSASKGPAAFFNLARKFLVTDEMCDLSALEGAIVSAVDAAHLLERSQLATIVRVHTSYVTVEPKRRKQAPQQEEQEVEDSSPPGGAGAGAAASASAGESASSTRSSAWAASAAAGKAGSSPQHREAATSSGRSAAALPPTRQGARGSSSGGRELRRARIVITVRRTDSYKRWLEENPLQAIIAGDADESDPGQASRGSKKS